MTSEQQALLQKAVRSLEAAKVLNREGLPEFAVTRAYYTMFYIVEAFLEGDNLSFSKHSAVISAFGQRLQILEEFLLSFTAISLQPNKFVVKVIMIQPQN
ncbi:HEPN domain-containing protein [Phormidesmis sp. 146-35]